MHFSVHAHINKGTLAPTRKHTHFDHTRIKLIDGLYQPKSSLHNERRTKKPNEKGGIVNGEIEKKLEKSRITIQRKTRKNRED